jgi:subtilase family serine protease
VAGILASLLVLLLVLPLGAALRGAYQGSTAEPAWTGGVSPNVIQRYGSSTPLTTAGCEATYGFACYQGPQLQTAYDLQPLFDKGIDGAGETIVIVDAYGSPTIKHDLARYDAQYDLPAPPVLKVIRPTGPVPAYNAAAPDRQGWAGETTLDVEMAHTVAPGADILLVETPVDETEGVAGFRPIVKAENYVIDHSLGDVISQSFGATESTFPRAASIRSLRSAYRNAARHDVTVLAATGDQGATDYRLNMTSYYTHRVVGWPASDPLVTAVGGTELHLNADGQRTSADTVWNDSADTAVDEAFFGDTGPNPLGSNGGVSTVFARPVYQDGDAGVVGDARGVPDIAMSAACDGGVETYESFGGESPGWYLTCGTSEATPLFAGIVALADQEAHHRLGRIDPALYAMAAHHAPGLVPVTKGDNTVSFTQGGRLRTVAGFQAGSGYNLASGNGTVDAAQFVPSLVTYAKSH